MKWDIRREGRSWSGDEGLERYNLTPEKFEMCEGRLFWSDTERVNLLALLLENVGADRAVRLRGGAPRRGPRSAARELTWAPVVRDRLAHERGV